MPNILELSLFRIAAQIDTSYNVRVVFVQLRKYLKVGVSFVRSVRDVD